MPVKLFDDGRLLSIDVHLKNVCPNQNLSHLYSQKT